MKPYKKKLNGKAYNANVIEDGGLTDCGTDNMDVFFNKVVEGNPFSAWAQVRTGIRSREKMYIQDNLGRVLQTGCGCGWGTPSNGANLTEKYLNTCCFKIYMEQCADVFYDTIFHYALKTGADINDLTDVDTILDIIMGVIDPAIKKDVFDILSFGSTANGTGFWSLCDGIWTIMENDPEVPHVDILPDTLTACSARDAMQKLVEGTAGDSGATVDKSDIVMRTVDKSQRVLLVSSSVYDNYLSCLEGADGCCSDGSFRLMQDGTNQLFYRGIPVIEVPRWDVGASELGLGAHRILYTVVGNIVVGFEEDEQSTYAVKTWYSQDDDIYKIGSRFRAGIDFVHPNWMAYSSSAPTSLDAPQVP
jgi:hypothetical protein